MKIRIEEEIYEGSPAEIAEQMREKSFYYMAFPNTSAYIEDMKESFERMTELPCPLPQGSQDDKARALFERLSDIDALEILED